MKYLLIAFFALTSLTISAQNTIISRPQQKKDQPSKPIKPNPQKKHQQKPTPPKPQSTPTIEEPPKHMLTASFANGELIANGVRYSFVKVEGGTFTMGATSEMLNAQDDEKPTHKVTLTNNYYMGSTEVTQALWKAVMGTNPSHSQGDNKPVECVSWDDCQTFISKLNAATGVTFRLPTEAEWEFAARGGHNSHHYLYSGGNDINAVAWFRGNCELQTHNVGTKQANELGLYDMSGNVYEWCNDWYGSYASYSLTNPIGPYSGSDRVARGGIWRNDAWYCRSSGRGYFHPDRRINGLGLRLVLTAEQSLRANVDVTRGQKISYESFNVNGVTFEMAKVEAGTFLMGATPEMQNPYQYEFPVHQVTLTKNYYLGKTEVTQALWKAVMDKKPSKFKGDNRPVERVSWNDCQEFIAKLNAITGKHFRLPTEAEWEYAARGGVNAKNCQYSGSNNLAEVGWFGVGSGTKNVAQKRPNELGIYDMSGNVCEWCADCSENFFMRDVFGFTNENGYINAAQTDPLGNSGSCRVLRGGCWNDDARGCRSSFRYCNFPNARNTHNGLRLALSE